MEKLNQNEINPQSYHLSLPCLQYGQYQNNIKILSKIGSIETLKIFSPKLNNLIALLDYNYADTMHLITCDLT